MKRRSFAVLCLLALLAALLTACGGSAGGDSGGSTSAAGSDAQEMPMPEYDSYGSTDYGWAAEPGAPADGEGQASGSVLDDATSVTNERLKNAKIIYTANLEMETTAFETCTGGLETLVEQLGGYMEFASANNYGNGYHGGNYTIRIPAENFEAFLRSTGEIGHITYQDKSGENVSEAYYDTESRLTTQRTKLERLQALLAQAENMADIITIEDAIAETEYAIEQLTGELRHYDALIDYATIYVSLREVEHLSTVELTPPTFATRLGTAFTDGWRSFTDGMEAFAIFLAYSWLWILLWIVVIVVVVTVVRRRKSFHWPRRNKEPKKPQDPGDGQS